MFDESHFFSNHWSYWRFSPTLTLGEAARLLQDDDPLEAHSNSVRHPSVDAVLTALKASIKTGDLEPFELWTFDEMGEMQIIPTDTPLYGIFLADTTVVRAEDLAAWADARGMPHCWPVGTAHAGKTVRDICRYPTELRAAIEAFDALSQDPQATAGRSPRQALLDWLASNRPEISNNARDRIATVANWQPNGGAPKTPEG